MHKFILSALLLAITFSSAAQKQKVEYDKETGTVIVNSEPIAKIIKENAPGQLGVNKNFTITNLEGKKLIYMVFTQKDIYDAWGRKTETKSFYVINFLESGRSSRKKGTMGAAGAAKLVGKNHLIVNGEIDPAAEEKFHLKY